MTLLGKVPEIAVEYMSYASLSSRRAFVKSCVYCKPFPNLILVVLFTI